MKTFFNSPKNKQKGASVQAGFAILMASLVASVVLAIGTVIADLAVKQIILSGSARESLNALYAADTGTECALYLDFRYNNSASDSFDPTTALCNEQPLTITHGAITDTETWNRASFRLNLVAGDSSGPCTDVYVDKRAPTTDQVKTRIQARGYNICPEGSGSGRRVERALQVEY